MVTGRMPFEGDSAFSIALKHKAELPLNPREHNPQLPEDLSLVVLKCLEKDREKRPQSAEELFSELTNIEKGIPTKERVDHKKRSITAKEITETFGLRKLLVPALVFIAVAAVGVMLLRLLTKKESIPPAPSGKPSVAIMYFKNDTGDNNLDHWRNALSQWLITDLSQSKHVYVLPMDRIISILRKLDLLEVKSYASEDLRKVALEGGISSYLGFLIESITGLNVSRKFVDVFALAFLILAFTASIWKNLKNWKKRNTNRV